MRDRDNVNFSHVCPSVDLNRVISPRHNGIHFVPLPWYSIPLCVRVPQRRETYRLSILDRADWLDPISLDRVDRLIAALADPEELRKHRAYQTDAEAGLRTSPNLILEMPSFAHPIIHEERPYSGVPGGGGGAPVGASGVGGSPAERAASGVATAGGGGGEGDGLSGGMGEGGRAWGASDLLARGGSDAFLLVSDYEIEEDNPVEQKYRKLAHDQLRGLVDPELKPNRDERHRIDELVAARQDHLKMEDKDLLWKFRYSLTDNKRCAPALGVSFVCVLGVSVDLPRHPP